MKELKLESAITKRLRLIEALQKEYDLSIKADIDTNIVQLEIHKYGSSLKYRATLYTGQKGVRITAKLIGEFAYADIKNHIEFVEYTEGGLLFTTYDMPEDFDLEDYEELIADKETRDDRKLKEVIESLCLDRVNKYEAWDFNLLKKINNIDNMETVIKIGIFLYHN